MTKQKIFLIACFFGLCVVFANCRFFSHSRNVGNVFERNTNSADYIMETEGIAGLPTVFSLVIGYNEGQPHITLFEPDANNPAFENNPSAVRNFPRFDVFNCAGYVGSGYISIVDGFWEIEFFKTDAAPDIVEKINRCSNRPPKDDDIASYGFAVAPADEARKTFVFKDQPALQKVFAALPVEEQKRAADADGAKASDDASLITKIVEKWYADADGDGAVDLISVSGNCAPYFTDGGSCEKIWQLKDGKWREVSSRGFDTAKDFYTYSKEPEILSGRVIAENGVFSFPKDEGGNIWQNGDSHYGITPKAVKTGTTKQVAVVNCAGYLATAKAEKIHDEPFRGQEDLYSWKLTIIPESVSPDAAKKVEKCLETRNRKDVGDDTAFALFDFSPEIKNVVFKPESFRQPDLSDLYNSLPDELRQWLEVGEKAEEIAPRRKAAIDAEYDDWADVDGDGTIDLISVYGVCSGTGGGGYSCQRIWRLTNGEWKEISFNTPL